ncbi:MAG: amino acid adenylation domain-containing protein [Eubacteriales bacterium]|nr:amino acid adenylation domain-containing protein [Eubacteriales bacterium]
MIRLVTDYLDASAQKFPDKTAFADENREISFKETKEEAQRIATVLIKRGFFKKPVAVFMDKRVECIPVFMGIAYSGNFYTVVDVHMPVARIEKIMDTLNPAVIITDKKHEAATAAFAGESEVLLYEELAEQKADKEELRQTRERIIDTDVLYVLFTSGSTGNPKGVIISHKAVIAYVEWGAEAFSLNKDTIFGNQTPFYFVMSGFDIYQTLRNGCTTYVIPRRLFSFPVPLLSFIREHRINTLYWVPSVLCLIANFKALPEVHLDDLKYVIFGGEVMPSKQLNMWRREYPDVKFVNGYGPTELTDVCTYYVVDREIDDRESLPIGIPCNHMDILVLDENGQAVPYGEIGELCGRGPSVAYGYYNNPEKTREAFVQNPLNPNYPETIYRTGDLVRYNERGELIYISRKDFQIKHMGNRIELGEIETAVSALEGIDMNCCLYDTRRSKIVLFYVGSLEEKEVRERLKMAVPEYMVPNRIKKMKQLPMNLNGKIDRAKLKEML